MLTLPEFIREVGDEEAARLFKVETRTAMSWRLMERVPARKKWAAIVKASKGRVDFSGIYAAPGPAKMRGRAA